MKFAFANDLSAHLEAAFGAAVGEVPITLCPPEFSGDVTINGFLLARPLRRNPVQIAQAVGEFLARHDDVEAVEVVKAFVNVTLKAPALLRDTVADPAALLAAVALPAERRRRILIEFSAPNTNKPQHLGHVRNNCIGMATAGLLRRVGHQVSRINLVNDRGIHICKSMLAYQRFGQGETPQSLGIKGDHLVGNYYVRFDAEFRRQLEALRKAAPTCRSALRMTSSSRPRSAVPRRTCWWPGSAAMPRCVPSGRP